MESMTFEIEHNIPIPAPKTRVVYPFSEMQVGDSFAIPQDRADRVRVAAINWGRNHGKKFRVRKNGTSARCWRVE
jgi:hypothetical protein